MAIIELNLEKPALVEEYQYTGGTSAGTARSTSGSSASESASDDTSESDSSASESSGGKGKLVGLLALVVGVGLLVWKLKSGSGPDRTDFEEFESESKEYEHGPEPEIGGDESGGAKRKVASVLGLVVAVASLGAVVRKVRS